MLPEDFMLQYSVSGEGEPEIETLATLQESLIRLQHLTNTLITDESRFTADIIFDNQDEDGKLYEVVFFSETGGYEFSEELLPLRGRKLG